MGFGMSQEIFMMTWQRPQISDRYHTGGDCIRLRDYSSFGAVKILMDADMPPLAKAGFYSCECQNPLPRRPIFEKFKGLIRTSSEKEDVYGRSNQKSS